jgi:hypothetical protein
VTNKLIRKTKTSAPSKFTRERPPGSSKLLKGWPTRQSKAGVENKDYKAQRSILADVDAGKISHEDLFARGEELMRERAKGFPKIVAAERGTQPLAAG